MHGGQRQLDAGGGGVGQDQANVLKVLRQARLRAEIAAHLARHGINVETQRAVTPEISVGDEILNAASDFGADLIVMGAYGHSRLRETMLGGVTRHVLAQMTAPALMSN